MKKKLSALFVCFAVLCAMLIPTFAAGPSTRAVLYQNYTIRPKANMSYYITVRDGVVSQLARVYPQMVNNHSQTEYQRWMPGIAHGVTKLYASFTVGSANQVVMYYEANSNTMDLTNEFSASVDASQVEFYTLNGSTGECRIQVVGYGKYLSTTCNYGDPINGSAYSESSVSQRWFANPV